MSENWKYTNTKNVIRVYQCNFFPATRELHTFEKSNINAHSVETPFTRSTPAARSTLFESDFKTALDNLSRITNSATIHIPNRTLLLSFVDS